MPNAPAARRATLAVALVAVVGTALFAGLHPASAQTAPVLLRDVRTGVDGLGSQAQAATPTDYIQPDTQIEPSIAVNPKDPLNVVTGYQEGRVDGGGDATNGWATSVDGGVSWTYGELPGLTSYPGQGGPFDRASDAVVAFGPSNDVYYSSLVFDDTSTNGLRSGMAINVSKDGGRSWSAPVFFADDMLGGLNDKNWVVVDNSDASGHHKGRVYVVWDRVAAVYYDYCDANCDQLANWALGGTFQQLDLPPAYVTQAIGATPVVLNDGSLAVLFNAAAGGVFTGTNAEQTFTPNPSTARLTSVVAPLAGTQPFGTPLVFAPPVYIADNDSLQVRAQRAGSLPSADYDTRTGTLAITWEDARFHTEASPVNDILVATSSDGGVTWSSPVKVNPGTATDYVDRYNPSISGGGDGVLHLTYRSRQEADHLTNFASSAQTWYQESSDGGKTWSTPLLVSTPANNLYYGAFSRNGTFEGDYNGIASAGGYSYVVRDEAYAAFAGEPVALTPDPSNPEQLVLSGKGHQHQQTWVAVVGPAAASSVASSGATPSPSAQPVSPAAVGATIGTPNTSAASSSAARVTLLAAAGLLGVVVIAGRRRRRRG
jgi:MYXO-CTERM domain-containing protein